jgi:hypothetical protein
MANGWKTKLLLQLRREGGGLMSAKNDLALAYHMGYDDALAKRKPDVSKAQVLAPYDLATENAKLRKLAAKMARALGVNSEWCDRDCAREFDCNEMDECPIEVSMRELGVEVVMDERRRS